MLAYELYLDTKDSTVGAGLSIPIKKIFVRKPPLRIELDSNTLEAYGGLAQPRTTLLQETLSMPLSNQPEVGLPDRRTGANSPSPYIVFYGRYRGGRVEIRITGTSQKRSMRTSFIYDTNITDSQLTEEVHKPESPSIILRLDKKHYRLSTVTLFEAYQQEGVVDAEGELSYDVFHAACKAFAEYCRDRSINEKLSKLKAEMRFGLVILPRSILSKKGSVEYVEQQDEKVTEHFVDAFGTESSGYSSKPTQTAKFLSFDDPAFTLNCKEKSAFYANLGIGSESLRKVNLLLGDCFQISGLLWYFTDLRDPNFVFTQTNSGIYDQLRANYELLRKKKGSLQVEAEMKVVCLKKTQSKLEVLLDENLTMHHLEEILHVNEFDRERHPMALEVLIPKPRGQSKTVLWGDYISAVKHFIQGIPLENRFLAGTFSRVLRERIQSWLTDFLNGKDSTERFFENSSFCMRLLSGRTKEVTDVNQSEEYAFRIGKIAGRYVQFRRESGEAPRSTADILTYNKYDREKLRHVYSRVSNGVCLETSAPKTPSNQEKNMVKFLEENAPKTEIDEANAYEDYSYFFYRGVFDSRKEGETE